MYNIKKSVFLLFLALFIFNCGGRDDKKGISFKLDISPGIISRNFAESITLTDRLFVNLNFEYRLKDNYKKIDGKYMVFVHLKKRDQKKIFLNYDHNFEDFNIKSISKWEKGNVFKYTKKIYIPKFLDNYGIDFDGYEMFDLSIGLYKLKSPNEKITLYQKEIRIEAEESHAAAIGYMKGWHGIENNPGAKDRDYKKLRWTSQKANCIIDNKNYKVKNPGNYTLIIKGGVPKGILKDQKIVFRINENEIDAFIPIEDKFKKEYSITPLQMGLNSTFVLTFETDKTFVPSKLNPKNNDNRELGMRIYSIYFRKSI